MVFWFPLPLILLVILAIIISLYKRKDPTNGMRDFVGLHGVVINPLDKTSGSVIVLGRGEVVKCRSYNCIIEEDETVLLTEYDEKKKMFRAEKSPLNYL